MKLFLSAVAALFVALTTVGEEPKTKPVAAVNGYEKTFDMKVADFEEFLIKEEKFTINNVLLREIAEGRRGGAAIKFAASVRNKSKSYESYTIMMVGMDEKKNPLWVSKCSTSVDGNGLGTIQDYEVNVPKGTLKATASVWMKVQATDQSDD